MENAERPGAQVRQRPVWRDHLLLMLCLAFGSGLTLLASSGLQQAEGLRAKERETAAAGAVISAFNLELSRTVEALRNAGLMLEANPLLTHEQFDRYMQKLVTNQLSVNLVEWQPVVPASQLAQFEAAARAAGMEGFRVVEPDASGKGWMPVRGRDAYVPVLFAWPHSYRTEGLDMSFSPQRMASKLQSHALGTPVASDSFEFMKEGKVASGVTAIAISTAVMGPDRQLRGYLAAVVDLPTLFGGASRMADLVKVDLMVQASAAPDAPVIYRWSGGDSTSAAVGREAAGVSRRARVSASAQTEMVAFAQQRWRVVLDPRPGLYDGLQTQGSRWALVSGLGMTGLLALALHLLQRSRRRIELAEATARSARDSLAAQTQRLQEAQRIAHVGGWHLDIASCQVTWSEQLYLMLDKQPGMPLPPFPEHGQFFAAASWQQLSQAVQLTAVTGTPHELELELVRPDGGDGWMLLRGEAHLDTHGTVVAIHGMAMDITERKRAEIEVKKLAFYDLLTRLPNRRLLVDRLAHALAASARHQRHGALLFIDLDNFKTVNDTLGHQFGDQLLQQVAERLTTCVREADTVGRWGGDEFVLILEDLSSTPAGAATQAELVGAKVLAALNQPYRLDSNQHHSTPSVGIALFADQDVSIEDLLKRADVAMYRAKGAGRNTVRFFDQDMQAVILARAALEGELRKALIEKSFVLHYQAQVDELGCLTGVEALVRMVNASHAVVAPMAFIGLAEETGLILPLGQWVLNAACQQLAAWAGDPSLGGLSIAVNVSAKQFMSPSFVSDVLACLAATGAKPKLLKLELTEGVLVDDVDDTILKMRALKAQGVGFLLDDFGTGYSSLSYLKRLPLDQLKIDQTFVKNLLVDPNDAAIARMVIVLAESLGLGVIAEGVETSAQRDQLQQLGCRGFQGFLFSRPLPIEAFEAHARQANAAA